MWETVYWNVPNRYTEENRLLYNCLDYGRLRILIKSSNRTKNTRIHLMFYLCGVHRRQGSTFRSLICVNLIWIGLDVGLSVQVGRVFDFVSTDRFMSDLILLGSTGCLDHTFICESILRDIIIPCNNFTFNEVVRIKRISLLV